MLRMVGDPFPSKGGLFAMLTAVGPFPSNGGVDFFQKSLGDPFPTSGRSIFFENGR